MDYFEHDGIRFSYLDRGTGPPLVLQHGMTSDAAGADDLYRSEGRLICLETRGHGETELGPRERLSFQTFAADVLALLDQLELDRVDMGGISMGAGIALRVAATAPERVARLILCRPAWAGPSPPHLEPLLVAAELVERFGLDEAPVRFEADPRRASLSPETTQVVLDQFDKASLLQHVPVMLEVIPKSPLTEDEWSRIEVPTLVFGNEADPIHPIEIARDTAARLPNARLVEVPSKLLDEERHAIEVTRAIDEFRSG